MYKCVQKRLAQANMYILKLSKVYTSHRGILCKKAFKILISHCPYLHQKQSVSCAHYKACCGLSIMINAYRCEHADFTLSMAFDFTVTRKLTKLTQLVNILVGLL